MVMAAEGGSDLVIWVMGGVASRLFFGDHVPFWALAGLAGGRRYTLLIQCCERSGISIGRAGWGHQGDKGGQRGAEVGKCGPG